MSDPRNYEIVNDYDGFYLQDEYGEDKTPTIRFQSVAAAEQHQKKLVDNWEPPDPPGWEGGFAANH